MKETLLEKVWEALGSAVTVNEKEKVVLIEDGFFGSNIAEEKYVFRGYEIVRDGDFSYLP